MAALAWLQATLCYKKSDIAVVATDIATRQKVRQGYLFVIAFNKQALIFF